ncbi:MAG: DUF4363 family protein [Eubacteriaceae bacterium]|nr:DUF4363 family protein [Eubacteriaceae bacterium]
MKALITSIISLGLVIGAWVCYYGYSTDTLEDMTRSCEEKVLTAIKDNDWKTAKKEFEADYKKWHKYRKTALYFLDTGDVNDTDSAFARALEYIDEEDASNGRGEVLSLKEQLTALKENEQISVRNIF